jgi:hypothetical protein
MALPDLDTFCVDLPSISGLCITFPGGAQFCAQLPSPIPPSLDQLAAAMMAQINVALAPLQPVFLIMDVVVAIVDCVKAVESCLGPPPNPSKLIACFPKLAIAIAKVLEILPPLSVPLMIAGILNMIVTFLKGFRAQLLVIIQKLMKLLAVNLRIQVTGSVQLQAVANCASNNLDAFLAGLGANFQPLACICALLNSLLDLIGVPQIPCLFSLSAGINVSILEELLIPLDDLILLLESLLLAFPMSGPC